MKEILVNEIKYLNFQFNTLDCDKIINGDQK